MEIFDDRRCVLGEGPFYDERTDRVGWVDITAGRVLWRAGGDAGPAGELTAPEHVGAAVPRANGQLALCLASGLQLDDTLITFPPAPTAIRANDAKADPRGRLWVGTIAYDGTPGAATLYRLDPGARELTAVLTGLTISNGLGWSPDGATMYHIDSPTKKIMAYPDGAAAHVLAEIDGDGDPDGMCVDAAGGVWVALFGGGAVRRYLPDGTLDRVVPVPTPQVTSCAFAGPGLDLLVITTAARDRPDDPHAGLTYVHRPGDVVGLPAHRFDG